MATTKSNFTAEHYRDGETHGSFSFLNPTSRRYSFPIPSPHLQPSSSREESQEGEGQRTVTIVNNGNEGENEFKSRKEGSHGPVAGVRRNWRSRDNRKGRHAIILPHPSSTSASTPDLLPPQTSSLKSTLHIIGLMFTSFPYWDISYLIAIIFTLGSVVWCINAFFVFLPLSMPLSEFDGEITDGGGWTAFIGATIFELGSILLMLEAVNENREDCFGWAVEEVLEGEDGGGRRLKADRDGCRHYHGNRGNLVGKGKRSGGSGDEKPSSPTASPSSSKSWTWFPTPLSLRTHYIHELGFLACSAQMIGATIFWISGFTALPAIYDRLTSTAAQNAAYYLPQVLGGSGFIVSGVLFMVETQKEWYRPALDVLGWWIGAWNLLGGIGFTLCGVLGFAATNSGCVYQGSLATFWGSWCFLIGSVVQWFESLQKHPVEVEK